MISKLVTPAHGSNFHNPKQNANAATMVRRHMQTCWNVEKSIGRMGTSVISSDIAQYLHAVLLLHLLINNFYLQFMSWISSDQKIRSRMSNKQSPHSFNQDLLCSRLCCKQQTASQQWQEASFTAKPLCGKNLTRLEAEVMSKNHLIQTHNPLTLYSIIMALVE